MSPTGMNKATTGSRVCSRSHSEVFMPASAGARPTASRRRLSLLSACAAVSLSLLAPTAVQAAPGAAQAFPWQDPTLSPDDRAELLLAQMTLEEKVELMTGDQGAAPAAY